MMITSEILDIFDHIIFLGVKRFAKFSGLVYCEYKAMPLLFSIDLREFSLNKCMIIWYYYTTLL